MTRVDSLTPNEDRVRAMPLPRRLVDNMAVPGARGVVARITAAFSRAQVLAIAREMDRASDEADILRAVAYAAGASLAAAILGVTSETPERRSELVLLLGHEVHRALALNTLHPDAETFANSVQSVPVGSA